jgi:glycosyltransferase involved in cell wall biosynthesis
MGVSSRHQVALFLSMKSTTGFKLVPRYAPQTGDSMNTWERTRRRLSVSAVLPAYNEEALIEGSVRQVAEVLQRLVSDFEVVVVNDGSRDRTAAIVTRLIELEPALHARLVNHVQNRGYGAALASGFDAARGDLVLMLDADGQFDVAEVVHLLGAMDDGTDMVIGYRARRADPPMRLLNAWGWKLLVNSLFGYTARDIDCAFKLFRRSVWRSMHVESRGATFSAEFLIKARRMGYAIKETPVTHLPRTAGSPTGAHPRVIARAFAELFNLRLRLGSDPLASVNERNTAVRPRDTVAHGAAHRQAA